MVRRCVTSRNLENEENKARYRAVKIQPQCVVTPGKQQQQTTINISYRYRSIHSLACHLMPQVELSNVT